MTAPAQASAEPAPLTEAELAEIEGREKMATPGPWTWSNDASRGAELRSGDDAILWSTMPYHDTTDIEGGAGEEAGTPRYCLPVEWT